MQTNRSKIQRIFALVIVTMLVALSASVVGAQDTQDTGTVVVSGENPLSVSTGNFAAAVVENRLNINIGGTDGAYLSPPKYSQTPVQVIGTGNHLGVLFNDTFLAYKDIGLYGMNVVAAPTEPVAQVWNGFELISVKRMSDSQLCALRAFAPTQVDGGLSWHMEYVTIAFYDGAFNVTGSTECRNAIEGSMTATEEQELTAYTTGFIAQGAGVDFNNQQSESDDRSVIITVANETLSAYGKDWVISQHPSFRNMYGANCGAPVGSIMQNYARFGIMFYEHCAVEIDRIVPDNQNGFDLPDIANRFDRPFRTGLNIISTRQANSNLIQVLDWQVNNQATTVDVTLRALQGHYDNNNPLVAPNSNAWNSYGINPQEIDAFKVIVAAAFKRAGE